MNLRVIGAAQQNANSYNLRTNTIHVNLANSNTLATLACVCHPLYAFPMSGVDEQNRFFLKTNIDSTSICFLSFNQRAFEDAAFGLQVNGLSGVVSTDSGVHLIMRTA